MNVTEAKMVKAFKEGRNVRNGPTKVWDCGHFEDMGCNRDEIRDGKYLLWGTVIAEKKDGALLLGVKGARWNTVLTRSRIHAIASEYGLPSYWTNKGVTCWSDGVPYDGVREFKL
jgi:hypothetical protein